MPGLVLEMECSSVAVFPGSQCGEASTGPRARTREVKFGDSVIRSFVSAYGRACKCPSTYFLTLTLRHSRTAESPNYRIGPAEDVGKPPLALIGKIFVRGILSWRAMAL